MDGWGNSRKGSMDGVGSHSPVREEYKIMMQRGVGPRGCSKFSNRQWELFLDGRDPWNPYDPDAVAIEADEGYKSLYELGYGPPGADKATVRAWQKYFGDMDRKEQERIFDLVFDDDPPYERTTFDIEEAPFCPEGVERKDHALWEKYYNQIRESEGFDIVDFPGHCEMATHVPMWDVNNNPKLFVCSLEALRIYNKREAGYISYNYQLLASCFHVHFIHHMLAHSLFFTLLQQATHFTLHQIVKANVDIYVNLYYITFEAIHPKDRVQATFQARVLDPSFTPKEIQVQLVRLKPTGGGC